jgi:hypothetical protein
LLISLISDENENANFDKEVKWPIHHKEAIKRYGTEFLTEFEHREIA